jgi:acyl-CoA thioester hydrolase
VTPPASSIETTRLGYHSVPARVQFGWVDAYGILWHGHALSYFEQARADIVRKFGLPARRLMEEGLAVPMVDLQVQYLAAARDDDELDVQVTLLRPKLPLPYLMFEYRLVRAADAAEILRGATRQVVMESNGRVLIRLPAVVTTCVENIWRYLDTRPRWELPQGHATPFRGLRSAPQP